MTTTKRTNRAPQAAAVEARVAAIRLYDAVCEAHGRMDVAMNLLNLVETEEEGPWTMSVAMDIASDALQKLLDAKLAYKRHTESERAR